MRDDKTGDVWSPTAAPIREARRTYVARHGRGYSRFEHASCGISANLLQYVPVEGSVKDIAPSLIEHIEPDPPTLSVTAFVEWVLGASRSATLAFVETEIDAANRRALRPQSVECAFRIACRFCRHARRPDAIGRAIAANS